MEPSVKVTFPVGIPAPGEAGETFTTNVSGCPATGADTDGTSAPEVFALFTPCEATGEVLPWNDVFPA